MTLIGQMIATNWSRLDPDLCIYGQDGESLTGRSTVIKSKDFQNRLKSRGWTKITARLWTKNVLGTVVYASISPQSVMYVLGFYVDIKYATFLSVQR